MRLVLIAWFSVASALLSLAANAADVQKERSVKVISAGEQRVALVIGNSTYLRGALTNPSNDAKDMSASLKRLGFDVIELLNGNRNQMLESLKKFTSRINSESTAIVFYAGHGVQLDGRNFLIPVDATITQEKDVLEQTVDLGAIISALNTSNSAVRVIILDACRNNPFASSHGTTYKPNSTGLAQVDAPPGSLIAFSTSPNRAASDGSGHNGLYTKHLLHFLETPNMRIEDIFKRVRIGVVEESQGGQVPWESTSLTEELLLKQDENAPLSSIAQGSTNSLPWHGTLADARAYLMTHPAGDQRDKVIDAFATLSATRPLRVAAEQTFIHDCKDCPALSQLYRDNPQDQEELLVGAYHVTISQYKKCADDGVCTAIPISPTAHDDQMPMTNISLADAKHYIQWLNNKKTAYQYRLPTEADWLRAFRSGYGRHDNWVERSNPCEIANLYDLSGSLIDAFSWQPLSCNDGFPTTSPIGSFLPSEDGLFDLIGNVWQWTSSCETEVQEKQGSCKKVKLFGGSWATSKPIRINNPLMLLADPDIAGETIGFRVFATKRQY